jgi:type II secretory ATPase GspE/PulE/Tfp pilus assembly ATPase PilB-like protein
MLLEMGSSNHFEDTGMTAQVTMELSLRMCKESNGLPMEHGPTSYGKTSF